MDLLHQLKNQLFFEENTDGEPQLYLVHRLDRPVGGVMVFARTKKAAASLTEQIKEHTFEKDYQAVLTGWLPDDEGTFRDYLLKDPKNNVSKIVKEGTPGAKEAILDYEVIDMMEDSKMKYTYCLIHLETGRHHQIRCQLAKMGCPIKGDLKYGSPRSNADGSISLLSHKVEFVHPVSKETIVVEAPLPDDNLWRAIAP